jgi:hypothetical protein
MTMTTRFHLTVTEQIDNVGDCASTKSCMLMSDGNYKQIVDVVDIDASCPYANQFEMWAEEDQCVVEYTTRCRESSGRELATVC